MGTRGIPEITGKVARVLKQELARVSAGALVNWVIGAGALAATVWAAGGSSVRERTPSLR
jgi:hypothetical protein